VKIQEKLDELRNNILRDTSDLVSGERDTLWSDETLLRYIKQGERRFARQVMCLRDSTTPQVTQVRLKTGVQNYPLHASVFAVLSARFDTDTTDLARSGHGILQVHAPAEDFLAFDAASAGAVSPGRPRAFNTDETLVYAHGGRVTLSTFPLPSSAEDGKTLYLRTLRTPLSSYKIEKMDEEESEIPEDYELDPLQWAAKLATANHDGDAGSATNSAKYEEAFNKAVADAVRETKRKLFANMTFRFGSAGFSWTR
jgi:hypothetical protein